MLCTNVACNKLKNCIIHRTPTDHSEDGTRGSVAEPVGAGAGVKDGSGSTLDKTEEILNDILLVCSNIE